MERAQGPLHVGICAEYDALPGIGHACGHNVIAAAAAVGAGAALAGLSDDLGLTVTVLGTPAEEGGPGRRHRHGLDRHRPGVPGGQCPVKTGARLPRNASTAPA
ncbi:hypothetical protein [Nonomuraea zeae]|uniref:hypothetical protein n=1 Tax=Nonomuraea zeae TaxID=1642303 RepID=UPI001980B156|nr:hypothetical protein [Nonomuraea zeae]